MDEEEGYLEELEKWVEEGQDEQMIINDGAPFGTQTSFSFHELPKRDSLEEDGKLADWYLSNLLICAFWWSV